MLSRWIILLLAVPVLAACERIALMTTPKKQAHASHSQLATNAEKSFWDILHNGQYAHIPDTQKLLLAAYLQNPNDPALAGHLGFLHIWKITERQRDNNISPTITNEIILSKKYFSDAVELDPTDARYQGFLGDTMLIEGQIFNDQQEQVRGYYQLKRAIAMWPQFNYFAAGYPMSTPDAHSERFRQALDWQWLTLDLCSGAHLDKDHPDFSPYMSSETQQGPMRACWNSWIAPHNFEGFFMNMGDMLVKSGEPDTAVRIYNNARLSKTYQSWPFKDMLEKRIKNANANVHHFQQADGHTPDTSMLINSGYGCVICHQAR